MTDILEVPGVARLDIDRATRTGIPELILGEGKTAAQVVAIAQALQRAGRTVIVTRTSAAQAEACSAALLDVEYDPVSKVLTAQGLEGSPPSVGRTVIFCAGTADISVAAEAERVLQALGTTVTILHDVGLAGPQRSTWAIHAAQDLDADAWIVVAGRDAALATFVAAHASVPVIGVPVSSGYGHGGKGEAALMAMLQSCAPLTVVNIDAGAVAALAAHQICRLKWARDGSRRKVELHDAVLQLNT